MSDLHGEVRAMVAEALNTSRRVDTGREHGLEELARSEVRRYLDRASLGWSLRQEILDMVEDEIARNRQGGA